LTFPPRYQAKCEFMIPSRIFVPTVVLSKPIDFFCWTTLLWDTMSDDCCSIWIWSVRLPKSKLLFLVNYFWASNRHFSNWFICFDNLLTSVIFEGHQVSIRTIFSFYWCLRLLLFLLAPSGSSFLSETGSKFTLRSSPSEGIYYHSSFFNIWVFTIQ